MKIDIVYTYVDGNDSNWRKKKSEHEKLLLGIELNAGNEARYMDNQELKYSLRSVEMFAPWVNKIFIVTDKQVPEWLNLTNSKIKIIDHTEIFSDVNVLPNFNAKAIETQIHHIKELSEYFIYFNDDMFLGRPTKATNFFSEVGKPKIFVSEIFAFPSPKAFQYENRKSSRKNDYQESVINTRILFREKFRKSVYYNIRHGVKPLLKSTLFELENIFSEEVYRTAKNKFRSGKDLMMFHLCQFYCLGNKIGKAVYLKSIGNDSFLNKIISRIWKDKSFGFINLDNSNLDNFLKQINEARPFVFCLNQTPSTPENNLVLMKQFLDSYFPEKSSFEK
ncbi:MAG: hypothetical protein Fur0015_00330 [Ignavibacteriales bacterium]